MIGFKPKEKEDIYSPTLEGQKYLFAKYCDVKEWEYPHRNALSRSAFYKAILDMQNAKMNRYHKFMKPLLIINFILLVITLLMFLRH